MFSGDGSADYVTRTQEIVQDYERQGAYARARARRAGERLLVGTVIAVLLKRARTARQRDQRF